YETRVSKPLQVLKYATFKPNNTFRKRRNISGVMEFQILYRGRERILSLSPGLTSPRFPWGILYGECVMEFRRNARLITPHTLRAPGDPDSAILSLTCDNQVFVVQILDPRVYQVWPDPRLTA
ncbi:hypothetical protein EGW08_003604, partial [Elysia chlorotica]